MIVGGAAGFLVLQNAANGSFADRVVRDTNGVLESVLNLPFNAARKTVEGIDISAVFKIPPERSRRLGDLGPLGSRDSGAGLRGRGKIVSDFPLEDFPRAGDAPKVFYLGRTALARGNTASAQRYFAAAAPDIEGGWAKSQTMLTATLNSRYSTLTCRGRRTPSEKVVEPSSSSRKAKMHFMARTWRPLWR